MCSTGLSQAATFTTLVSFGGTNGTSPSGLLLGTDGNFYGTTWEGGQTFQGAATGTVFQVTPQGVLTTIHAFPTFSHDGLNPLPPLVQRKYDGNLYGITAAGGRYGYGMSFSIFPGGGGDEFSYPFDDKLSYLNSTTALFEGSDGNFYGTTYSGGTNSNMGTVFQMTFNGRFTTLYDFSGGSDGGDPSSLLQGSDGCFYGTTSVGGWNNAGTVFKLTTNGTLTTLYSFRGTDDGYYPIGLLQATDGNLYGVTQSGGTNHVQLEGDGTIFRATTNGNLTTLFSFNGTNGSNPQLLLQGLDSNLYGTTYSGGAGYGGPTGDVGTVFKFSRNGVFLSLYSFVGGIFDSPDGAQPSGLVQGRDGNLYGVTYYGGTNGGFPSFGYGTVFRIELSGPSQPVIQEISQVGGMVFLTWNASPGQRYQVQCSTNWTQNTWNILGVVTATNSAASFSDVILAAPSQRFYRVFLVQ